MKIYCLFLIIFLLVPVLKTNSQISQGGQPMEPVSLKNGFIPVATMPAVNNSQLLKSSLQAFNDTPVLKPLKFAHTFDVDLNPLNSGRWIKAENGYNIWQLRIRSDSAYSINLIFQPFRLPPNARLFIYNNDKTQILGAFTDFNNKSFNSLAISPVRGDDITIQYEEPPNPQFKGQLAVKKVNHDFLGILTDPNGRRPLGISGTCNIDVNCDLAKNWKQIKNSVCRVIIEGSEVCTGSMLNNTREDKTPYVLTAHHCFADFINGEHNTVFLFNYESPYCGSIDGDITNSVSGSLKVAESDTLDFSLVKLSLIPPPDYRPYYAGWDHSGTIPDSVAVIHHPLGDIKKIALDYDSPVISSFGNDPDFMVNGFWRTLRWDYGTTEAGSSGAPYFNQDHRLIGSLTGGVATCSNPVNDYFERLDRSWDHYADSLKQLKHWLDPLNSGVETLNGMDGYKDADFCDAFTHLIDGDSPVLTPMLGKLGQKQGYWAGTNDNNITEFVEKFSIPGNETLDGLSLGIAKLKINSAGTGSHITINVYNGSQNPESLIYSKDVPLNNLVRGAMNFVGFDKTVQPEDTFFVGFDLSHVLFVDSIAIYQAVRVGNNNSLYYKQNNTWLDYHLETGTLSASLAFELVACNVQSNVNDTPRVKSVVDIELYPNPANSEITLRTSKQISINDISVFDLLGREVMVGITQTGSFEYELNLAGKRAGIYFVRVRNRSFNASQKFYYNPY